MYRSVGFFIVGVCVCLNVAASTHSTSSELTAERIAAVNGSMSVVVGGSVRAPTNRTGAYDEEVDGAERDKLNGELLEEARRRKDAEDTVAICNQQVDTLCTERDLLMGVFTSEGYQALQAYIEEAMTDKLKGYKDEKENDNSNEELEEDIQFQERKIAQWSLFLTNLHEYQSAAGSGDGTTLNALRAELETAKAKLTAKADQDQKLIKMLAEFYSSEAVSRRKANDEAIKDFFNKYQDSLANLRAGLE